MMRPTGRGVETATHVALLRGINVGRARRVPMAGLRELVAGLGHRDVRTVQQSGNVLLTAAAGADAATVAAGLERAVAERFGLDVAVLVRTRRELVRVVEDDPLAGSAPDPARHLVLFLSAEPDPGALAAIDPAAHSPEQFRVVGREVHLWCPGGVLASTLLPALSDRRLGVTTTARNWRTLTRLVELAGAERERA